MKQEAVMEYDDVYLGVIAGGKGTRLFPLSHKKCPKQFCPLNEDETFIQATVNRFAAIGIRPENMVVIVTTSDQMKLARKQLLRLGILSTNIHQIQPHFGYAGAMIKAADFIQNLNEDAVIVNTPADQYIVSDENFKETMRGAIESARSGIPTLVGVKVTDLNTVMGCGHAQYDLRDDAYCKTVTGFVEKPNAEEADKLMRKGDTACNTGINAWMAKTVLAAAKDFIANDELSLETDELMNLLGNKKLAVGKFEWYDCGTLKSLYEISKKTPNHKNANSGKGSKFRYGCRGSHFYSIENVELHVTGVEDASVIATDIEGRMVITIVRLDESQTVRDLAEDYDRNGWSFTQDFSMGARNNRVLPTNISDEIQVGFVGVHDYSVAAIKYPDGRIVVLVSNGLAQVKAS